MVMEKYLVLLDKITSTEKVHVINYSFPNLNFNLSEGLNLVIF